MSSISRILQYIENKRISKYEFYKKTGLSNGFLDKNRNIGSDNCEKIIYAYPDMSLEWLITGKGEMIKKSEKLHILEEPTPSYGSAQTDNDNTLPLIPIDAMAGYAAGDITVLELDCERYVVPAFKGADFLIAVRGSSMYPKYNSGDIVACKKLTLDTFFQWNHVYVVDTDQGVLIKRIHKGSTNETILLVSDNEKYPPFEVPLSQIRSISLVIGVIRHE